MSSFALKCFVSLWDATELCGCLQAPSPSLRMFQSLPSHTRRISSLSFPSQSEHTILNTTRTQFTVHAGCSASQRNAPLLLWQVQLSQPAPQSPAEMLPAGSTALPPPAQPLTSHVTHPPTISRPRTVLSSRSSQAHSCELDASRLQTRLCVTAMRSPHVHQASATRDAHERERPSESLARCPPNTHTRCHEAVSSLPFTPRAELACRPLGNIPLVLFESLRVCVPPPHPHPRLQRSSHLHSCYPCRLRDAEPDSPHPLQ